MKRLFLMCICLFGICAAANATLVKSYDFNGSYADTLENGEAIVGNGGVINEGLYAFSANQGLSLSSALLNPADYAIEMRLRVLDSVGYYNKLIDFRQLGSDTGLYIYNGEIDFYVSGNNLLGGNIGVNEFFTIAFVRKADIITTFLNGEALLPFTDASGQAIPQDNLLYFFEDDRHTSQRESFVGEVDFIRIHSDETTFGDDPEPTTPAPVTTTEPNLTMLLSVFLVVVYRLRRNLL